MVARCGGPNAGHTIVDKHEKTHIFQQLPTSAILHNIKLAICAGSYIDTNILLNEIHKFKITPKRLFIDPKAIIITDDLKQFELNSGILHSIGSTGSGTGSAVISRIQRRSILMRAEHVDFVGLDQKTLFPL